MTTTTDDGLIITRVRLCDCGKPADHPDACAFRLKHKRTPTVSVTGSLFDELEDDDFDAALGSNRTEPIRQPIGAAAIMRRDIRNALAQLELVSHAPTATWDKTSRDTSGHPGGNRPPGSDHEPRPQDLAERLDWYESYHHKTVGYFRRALNKPNADHAAILEEINGTVEAWRHRPIKHNAPMSMADSHWKLWVATSKQDAGTLARQFGCTRQVIYHIRHRYARETA